MQHIEELREIARSHGLNRAVDAAKIMMTNERSRLRFLNALKAAKLQKGDLVNFDPGVF